MNPEVARVARPKFADELAKCKSYAFTGPHWAEAETLLNSDSLTVEDRKALRSAVRANGYSAMRTIMAKYRVQPPAPVVPAPAPVITVTLVPPTTKQWNIFTGVMWPLLQSLLALLWGIVMVPVFAAIRLVQGVVFGLTWFFKGVARFCRIFVQATSRVYRRCGRTLMALFTLIWTGIGYVGVWGFGIVTTLLQAGVDGLGQFMLFLAGKRTPGKEAPVPPPEFNETAQEEGDTCPENHTNHGFKCCEIPPVVEEWAKNPAIRKLFLREAKFMALFDRQTAQMLKTQNLNRIRFNVLSHKLRTQMQTAQQQDLLLYGIAVVFGTYGASKAFGAGRRFGGIPGANAALAATRRAAGVSLASISTWDGAMEVAGHAVKTVMERKALLSFMCATGVPYLFSFLNNATLFHA